MLGSFESKLGNTNEMKQMNKNKYQFKNIVSHFDSFLQLSRLQTKRISIFLFQFQFHFNFVTYKMPIPAMHMHTMATTAIAAAYDATELSLYSASSMCARH